MDALIIVDMQEATRLGAAKRDFDGVVERIDRLAERVRGRGGRVVFVQHDGGPEEPFAPHAPGWELLRSIGRQPGDHVVRKTLNDAFAGTTLRSDLVCLGCRRLLVTGWATDLCVDATVRSAVASGFEVVVVADGHTVSDRPHLSAERVIEHHHWLWGELIAPRILRVVPASEL